MASRVDLTGRTAIVTGASAGIGKEIARGLALARARVILACRNREKGEAAREDIASDSCNDAIELLLVDTSSRASIASFADEFQSKHDALHILVNNAGVWGKERKESVDGIELTWATNVLGYFRLTNALLPLLKKSAPSRIINVASKLARDLDLSDVEFKRRKWNAQSAYAQSKQADRMLTWELAERLEGSKVTANAVHPGLIASELSRENTTGLYGAIFAGYFRYFGKTTTEGADNSVWLATSDETEMSSGNYYEGRKIKRCKYRDPAAQKALWELCEKMA
jgi:NAD(P)-dependent dehydrogenase (short-subunit alcohol dehydrogenase family)